MPHAQDIHHYYAKGDNHVEEDSPGRSYLTINSQKGG